MRPLYADLSKRDEELQVSECDSYCPDFGDGGRNGAPETLAAEAAGVPWAGFHTLRYTCATRLFAEGRNVKQVQLWLGHHAPSFTLDTYVKCLNDDLGEPLGAPQGVNKVSTAPTPEHATAEPRLRVIAA